MERLQVSRRAGYSALEASIHVGRYAPLLPHCSGRRVLDLACGEGYGSWLMSRSGAASVLGVDVSPDAVRRAKRSFRTDGLSFAAFRGEEIAAKLAPASFDLVACIETIEHVADPTVLLRQIRQVAAPGAIIYITCPNDAWYYGEGPGNPFHTRRFTFDEFRQVTEGVLGEEARWLLGTAAMGFTTLDLESVDSPSATPSEYVDVQSLHSAVLCRPGLQDEVEPKTSSYFVGIWNDESRSISGGAFYPMSMDAFAERENAPTQLKDLQRALEQGSEQQPSQTRAPAVGEARADLATLGFPQVAAALEANIIAHRESARRAELAEREARSAAADAIADAELARNEAAACRFENEKLTLDVLDGRAKAADAIAEIGRLEAALAESRAAAGLAHEERVAASAARAEAARAHDRLVEAAALTRSLRVQASVLRSENDVLARRVAELRAEAAAGAEAQVSAAAAAERVDALESALARMEDEAREATVAARSARTQALALRAENDVLAANVPLLAGRVEALSQETERLPRVEAEIVDLRARLETALFDRERFEAVAATQTARADFAESRFQVVVPMLGEVQRAGRRRRMRLFRSESPLARTGRDSIRQLSGLGAWPPSAEDRGIRRRLVERSGLFDAVFYAENYGDVAATGADLLDHFLDHGGREGRSPGPRFDSAAYLRGNPDVREGEENPLVHFLLYGAAEGRRMRDA